MVSIDATLLVLNDDLITHTMKILPTRVLLQFTATCRRIYKLAYEKLIMQERTNDSGLNIENWHHYAPHFVRMLSSRSLCAFQFECKTLKELPFYMDFFAMLFRNFKKESVFGMFQIHGKGVCRKGYLKKNYVWALKWEIESLPVELKQNMQIAIIGTLKSIIRETPQQLFVQEIIIPGKLMEFQRFQNTSSAFLEKFRATYVDLSF